MNDDAAVTAVVSDFLAYKRALGRKYETEEAALRLLVRFADEHGVTDLDGLTGPLLEEFLGSRPRHRARSFNHLVLVVTGFLNWAVAQGRLPACPLQRIRRPETAERLPFIFETSQVRLILAAAGALDDNPRARNRAMIHRTVFALCYGLGLRAGEACNLQVGDVDTDRQLITVRGGKFGKSRLVPHGPRIGELLTSRLNHCSTVPTDPLFSFDGRRSIHPCTSSSVFHQIITELDFTVPDGVSAPRLHSLRHSFAVGCLLRWYREGIDPSDRLFRLSTFMGHVSPESTAVYLRMTPELLTEGADRFETYAQSVWMEATP
ncbi:tyrosine-type recombinase/integrase [Leucobacter sp. W1038]|uniref:tyrosine-type recombinase/integrase n=1 Tax=Leucobacter sp. W1038 TaxID=3438281 RepID=UPI003D981FBC